MKVNAHLMKELNKAMILSLVIKHTEGISRVSLAKTTGFSKSTVSMLTEELQKEGLIIEGEMGSSTKKGGRKPVALQLNKDAGYIVSVLIKKEATTLSLGRFNGKFDQELIVENDGKQGVDLMLFVLESLEIFVESVPKKKNVVGIGMSIPGLVDADKKTILYSPELQVEQYDFSEWEIDLKCPVCADNDVNMVSAGENWFGYGKHYKDFIQLSIGTGVGGAIIIEHKIYKGSSNSAGEVGYMAVGHEETKQKYSFNTFGFFESQYSVKNLENTYQKRFSELVHLAKHDKKIREDIILLSRGVAKGIATIVSLLNPQAIVLNGRFTQAQELVEIEMKNEIRRITPITTEVEFSELGDQAGKIGAIATVMSHLYGVTYL